MNDDLNDEIVSKNEFIKDLESQVEKKSLTSSASSLCDELQQVKNYECDHCSLDFVSVEELKTHEIATHEEKNNFRFALLTKMANLQNEVSEQRLKVTSSLFELRNREIKSQTCHCKRFCRIYHQKHNFVRSESEPLFSKLKSFSSSDTVSNQIEISLGCFVKKCYTCKLCDINFSNQGDLKKHIKDEHKARDEKIGEVEESVQAGEVSK